MNYRHAFHAGNFADVVKLVALAAAILPLGRKKTPYCVIDTHAGAGLYDLAGRDAMRTGEAAEGIGRIRELAANRELPDALASYLACVARDGEGYYPGSARVAARLIRPGDRLVAIEKERGQAAALRAALAEFRNARVIEGDGYLQAGALLPPGERRGVILIDPPYEADDEFERAADVLARAHRRFAAGVYLLWYPIKSRTDADALAGELRVRGVAPMLRIEIDIGKAPTAAQERLSAAGLLVVNPPYGFEEEMGAVAAILAPRLGRTPLRPAKITIDQVAS